MPAAFRFQLLGEAPADLIEDQADERLGPADVRRRHDEIEGHRMLGLNEIADAPVAARRDGGDDWIARSEEHTSELQSLMRISYAVLCLKQKKQIKITNKDKPANTTQN